MGHYRDGGADIGDYDLDTGERLAPIPTDRRRVAPRGRAVAA